MDNVDTWCIAFERRLVERGIYIGRRSYSDDLEAYGGAVTYQLGQPPEHMHARISYVLMLQGTPAVAADYVVERLRG
jgi:hypothetical protein